MAPTPASGIARLETIKLRSFIEALLADFELAAGARRVALDGLVFSDELKTDAGVLRRVLTGLVGGALRRAPAGTNISLVVSPRGSHTEFRVADEGAGIAVGTRERVFDTGADGLSGDASGLKFCMQAAQAHGGELSVVETDTGTVVCLAFPNQLAANADEPAGTTAPARTVLVVDDEPLVRAFVVRALRDTGYGVVEADSAERAMEILHVNRQSIAFLLSDVGLPGASGAELVRRARRLWPELPALLMSATPKSALARDGVLDRDSDLLQKPFAVVDLLSKLETLLPTPSRHAPNPALAAE